jgi:hypothetical protein
MDIKQASQYVGKSDKTIRRYMKQGLKGTKEGRSYSFTKSDLDTFMAKHLGQPRGNNPATHGHKPAVPRQTKVKSPSNTDVHLQTQLLKSEITNLTRVNKDLKEQVKRLEQKNEQLEERVDNILSSQDKMFDKLTDITSLVTQQNEKLSLLAQTDNLKKLQAPDTYQEDIINVSPGKAPEKIKAKKSKGKKKSKRAKKKHM